MTKQLCLEEVFALLPACLLGSLPRQKCNVHRLALLQPSHLPSQFGQGLCLIESVAIASIGIVNDQPSRISWLSNTTTRPMRPG